MALLSKFFQRVARACVVLQSPRLFKVRLRGGSVSTVVALDQPWLHELCIASVLDVGANAGQFALSIRAVLPHARIVSFEPLPDCCEELKRRMKGDADFTAVNAALGDAGGEMQFQRNEFSPASSFLELNDSHKAAFTFAQRTDTVTVKVQRLDDVAASLNLIQPYMVKIDVQGFEDRVIRGGEQTLRNAALLIVEMSHVALYAGQPLFNSIYNQISSMDFIYAGAVEQMHCPVTGKILQSDGIFLKVRNAAQPG